MQNNRPRFNYLFSLLKYHSVLDYSFFGVVAYRRIGEMEKIHYSSTPTLHCSITPVSMYDT